MGSLDVNSLGCALERPSQGHRARAIAVNAVSVELENVRVDACALKKDAKEQNNWGQSHLSTGFSI